MLCDYSLLLRYRCSSSGIEYEQNNMHSISTIIWIFNKMVITKGGDNEFMVERDLEFILL